MMKGLLIALALLLLPSVCLAQAVAVPPVVAPMYPPVLLAPPVYSAPVMVRPPVYAPPVMVRPPVYGYPYVQRVRYWTPLRDFFFGTHRVQYVPYTPTP